MKRALVLSGGGAKGSFQYGALRYIQEVIKPLNEGFKYNVIAGVSVGTLNGSMVAMDKYDEMKTVWETVDNSKIYTGKLSVFSVLLRILFGKKSALGNEPLQKLVAKYISLKDVKSEHEFRMGVVSLIDGLYQSLKATDFDNDDDFRKAVIASTVMPIIWAPVKEFKTKNGTTFSQVVDGGLRNVSPLGDIIDSDPDEIIIINCSNTNETRDEKASKNIFTIAARSLTEIAINEIFNSDINEFIRINDIINQLPTGVSIKKRSGKPFKPYKYILIEPSADMGDSLDFSQPSVQMRMKHGRERAEAAFKGKYNLK